MVEKVPRGTLRWLLAGLLAKKGRRERKQFLSKYIFIERYLENAFLAKIRGKGAKRISRGGGGDDRMCRDLSWGGGGGGRNAKFVVQHP